MRMTKTLHSDLDKMIESGHYFRTNRGTIRLTEKGWNELPQKNRFGNSWNDYKLAFSHEGGFD